MDALAPLEKTVGGSGAMCVMAKLPSGTGDMVRDLYFERLSISVYHFCTFLILDFLSS